jgi:hypothetical protein
VVVADLVPVWGVFSAAAAPVLLVGGWTLAARLQRDGFDSITGTISALAAEDADRRGLMTAALLGVGLAHVTTACALRPAPRAGRVVLALGGAATIGVAAAPLPAGDGGSAAHAASAAVAFVGLAVWPAFSGRPSRAWPFTRTVALAVGGVLLAEVAGFFAVLLADGPRPGLVERVTAGSQALAPLVAVLISRARSR